MASKPKHICNACGALVSGRCASCRNASAMPYNATRGSSHERGYGAKWQAVRIAYLQVHPLCVWVCSDGRPCNMPATEVDHIVPVTGADDPSFWIEDGYQSLCGRHHRLKTARERGRKCLSDVSPYSS